MLAYRQRGLINVYAFIANFLAVGLLLVYGQLIPYIPGLSLSETVNLLPYCLAVFVGMAASIGHVRARGYTLHILGWIGGMSLALRQVFFVAACIFGLMFATKDRDISRLFLGSYLVLMFGMLTQLHAQLPAALAQWLFGENAKMPTLFIGSSADMENLDDWISNRGHLGIKPVGFVADEKPTRADDAIAPHLGRIDQLRELMLTHHVRQVVLLQWMADTERMERIVEACEAEGCRFLIHNNFDARFA